MDRGILNLPLAKRGDDLFGLRRADVLAAQKAERTAAVAQRKAAKAEAKELLAEHQAAIVARHGQKFGIRELQTTLDQWAKWEPKTLISFVRKFLNEQPA